MQFILMFFVVVWNVRADVYALLMVLLNISK
jgi:hypothetical protein